MSENVCGCTCHELNPDDSTVLLNGVWWNPICALKESIRLLGKTNQELSKLQAEVEHLRIIDQNYKLLMTNVESLICPNCFSEVKDKWAFSDGQVICVSCMEQLNPGYF